MLLGSTATRPGITGSLQAISAAFKITNYIFEKHMAVRTRKKQFLCNIFWKLKNITQISKFFFHLQTLKLTMLLHDAK